MAKKIMAIVKLQIQAGKANPAPPVGPALGQHGVNIMQFCKEYNARTQAQAGMVIPVEVIHLPDQDAPGEGPPVEGGRRRQGIGRAEQDQGRFHYPCPTARDRRDQDAGPKRG
jgi:hypothetical protein